MPESWRHWMLCAWCMRDMPTCDEWPECGLQFCNGSAMCDECWLKTIRLPIWKAVA